MSSSAADKNRHPLARWQLAIERHAVAIVLASIIATVASAFYIQDNLRIDTDTAELLSEALPWRQVQLAHRRAFPQYSDNIVVVIDGDTPDLALDAAAVLAGALAAEPEIFKAVYAPQLSKFMRDNALLYLDSEELEDLADNLVAVQPFLARLAADQSVRGVAGALQEATDALADGDDIRMGDAYARVAGAVEAAADGRSAPLSWQALMQGREPDADDRRVLLTVHPRLEFDTLLPGRVAIERTRALAASLGLTPERGVRVRLTGGAALGYEQMLSVSAGGLLSSVLAFVLVTVVLAVGLRSPWLVLATQTVLVSGLALTTAFATLAVGQLNLISVAFAAIFIGLGADYATYYCMHFRELRASQGVSQALATTSRHVGGAVSVCALTNAVGFCAYVPTSYTGVAELGIITAAGIVICLGLSLTLLPALLRLLPVRPGPAAGAERTPGWLEFPERHARGVCTLAVIAAIAAATLLPGARFDHNPIHLQNQDSESVRTYLDLLAQSSRSPLSAVALSSGPDEARRTAAGLEALPEVDSVLTIENFVPGDQEAKLAVIADLALALGTDLEPQADTPAPDAAIQVAALADLASSLRSYLAGDPEAPAAGAQRLLAALDALLADRALAGARIALLQDNLLRSLPGRLAALGDSLQPEAFGIDRLPDDIRSRWISADGHWRVEVFPSANLDDNSALERFVTAIRGVLGDAATGTPVVNLEAQRLVIAAFEQAFASALVVITIVVYLSVRRWVDVALVLTPILLGGLLTGAVTVLLDMPFHFANIIALPVLLGTSVDASIHMLLRFRAAPPGTGAILGTSTARAIVTSALTNMCGFGTLALSQHPGTADMGILLTLGILSTLVCTLVLLPGLLRLVGSRGSAPTGATA